MLIYKTDNDDGIVDIYLETDQTGLFPNYKFRPAFIKLLAGIDTFIKDDGTKVTSNNYWVEFGVPLGGTQSLSDITVSKVWRKKDNGTIDQVKTDNLAQVAEDHEHYEWLISAKKTGTGAVVSKRRNCRLRLVWI
jgi:hypothetical protein